MPHNLRLQCSVTDTSHRGVDYVSRWVVVVEHAQGTVRDVLDWCIVIRRHMELSAMISAGERESTYDVQICGHVNLDETSWGRDSVLVGDGEGNEVFTDVVDETFGWSNWHHHSCCCCACVSWGGRWPY